MTSGSRSVNRLPVRIAGMIGMVAALIYLAGVLAQAERGSIGAAVLWALVMVGAGLASLYAHRFEGRERTLTTLSGGIFFVLALISGPVLAIVFLTAVVLTVVGLGGKIFARRGAVEP